MDYLGRFPGAEARLRSALRLGSERQQHRAPLSVPFTAEEVAGLTVHSPVKAVPPFKRLGICSEERTRAEPARTLPGRLPPQLPSPGRALWVSVGVVPRGQWALCTPVPPR